MMARFAPFETRPHIAIAVSGGADSMALAALGASWAQARGGAARAFIVDHGLRPESSAEAQTVAERCRAMGLAADILVWTGPKPRRGIQAAARQARYDLLATACHRARSLHLLVAHHRDDQAETVALRAERASASGGLAGMTAVAEWQDVRLLRPLLDMPKDRLVATARARGLAWVEDPSNIDTAFARARLRGSGRDLPSPDVILAHQRRRLLAEAQGAVDLAGCTAIHPAGFAELDHRAWLDLASERRSFVVTRLAMSVGGLAYPPRRDRLSRFLERLGGGAGFASATLGRCLWRRTGQVVRITRENRHLSDQIDLEAGKTVHWDGRFLVTSPVPGVCVAALGAAGWRRLREQGTGGELPEAAAVVVPAFHDLEGLAAVPHLQWQRCDAAPCRFVASFAPHHALAPAGFVAIAADDPVPVAGTY
jgi:tRNA(Ile)-lysidine synthase